MHRAEDLEPAEPRVLRAFVMQTGSAQNPCSPAITTQCEHSRLDGDTAGSYVSSNTNPQWQGCHDGVLRGLAVLVLSENGRSRP